MNRLLGLCIVVSFCSIAKPPDERPYDFDWHSAADMSGAFFMCSLYGFREGDCDEILEKCMTDPKLLKFKTFGVESKCLDLYAFATDDKDAEGAIEYASDETGVEVTEEQVNNYSKANNYEQDSSGQASRESYIDTKYYRAEEAAAELVIRDYEYFYYYGDGNGNGGWGHADYGREEFNTNVYSGISPDAAYDKEYNRMLNMGGCQNSINNKCHGYEKMAHESAEQAKSVAIEQRDKSYNDWRESQAWGQYGYKQESFENTYNKDRLTAYYNAYLEQLPSCGGNDECAKSRAWDSIKSMPLGG
ncbi:hypothetical protein [Pseudoalteromonas nigrifaciens]|uniref:hypothetical protein n=1 Tax=Pseudoalteromonas nigrifaciens TaxID=28109 RepID=UPI003FD21CA0